ncbi:MAG: hypothetical protein LBU67_04545 [Oscillospiraceae bacterium]|nr:hypothetical protein [Oscillospiraceae bacterium]
MKRKPARRRRMGDTPAWDVGLNQGAQRQGPQVARRGLQGRSPAEQPMGRRRGRVFIDSLSAAPLWAAPYR